MKIAIFKVNQLGDNLVFLPVVQALRRYCPEWELFLFTSPVAAELFAGDLAPGQICLTTTPEFNGAWKRPDDLLRFAVRLWREKCDASFLSYDQSNVAHLLARTLGGQVRVGSKPSFIKVPCSLTEVVPLAPEMPIAQKNWETVRALVRALDGPKWGEKPPAPDLSHLFGDTRSRERRVVIHPGASLVYQRWLPERYVVLANRLAEQYEVVWVEQSQIPSTKLEPRIKRFTPGSLRELAVLLRSANLMIGNNSGPMHIASALGCPAVIIMGPSNPVWDPFWNREKFLILRDESLPCLPCDRTDRPAIHCHNTDSPLACLRHWTVDDVFRQSCAWMARWADALREIKPAT